MGFPVPVEYGLNDTKDNTIVKYNNGTEWEGLPSPLPGGGGGGDVAEEVENIRIGADGTVYPTAGDAVRGQVSDLKEDLTQTDRLVYDGFMNLTSSDFTQGQWGRDGSYDSTSARNIRTKTGIRVKKGNKIVTKASSLWISWHVLDAEGNITEEYYRTASYYKYQITDRTYTFTSDGTLYITVANGTNYGNSSAIVPSDMTATIQVINTFAAVFSDETTEEINNLSESVDSAKTGIETFPASAFKIGGLVGGEYKEPTYWTYARRVTTPNVLIYDRDIIVTIGEGYRFGIALFVNETWVDSGWLTTPYTIPANTTFKVTIGKIPEVQTDPALTADDIPIIAAKLTFATVLGERVATIENIIGENFDHDTQNGFVNVKRYKFNVENTGILATYPTDITVSTASSYQGFAVCNGIIFQLYSDNALVLVDIASKSVIAELAIECGHGNNINFSNEFYDANDEFPLAYVNYSNGGDDNIVKVIRITRTGCTTIRTIKIAGTNSSWFAQGIIDALNNILYMVGYKESSYREEREGRNRIVVSKFDLASVTTNEDGTITPAKLDSFEIPFYTTSQGAIMFDGKIMLVSSHYSNTQTKIIVIDPVGKRVSAVVSDFPESVLTHETEGIAAVENGANYAFLLKTNTNTNYYKMVF